MPTTPDLMIPAIVQAIAHSACEIARARACAQGAIADHLVEQLERMMERQRRAIGSVDSKRCGDGSVGSSDDALR